MAKKDKKNELDFDDGLDDLDFGFSDDDFSIEEPKDDRKPVSKVATSFLEGVKDDLINTDKLRDRAQEALPAEYTSTFEAVDKAADIGRDLYNTAADELRPAAIQLKRLTRKVSPRLKNALPGKLGEKLDDWARDNEVKGPDKDEVREQGIATELGDIFKTQVAKEHEDRKEETVQRLFRERVQDHQFQTELEALKEISAGIGSLTSYQDQITAKYQRKSLELQYRQYYTTHDIFELSKASSKETSTLLKNIVKNTSLPESEKIKLSEQAGQMFRERFINRATDFSRDYFKNYGKNLVAKFKESMGSINESLMTVADQVEMASESGVEIDPWKTVGNELGSTVSDKLVGMALTRLRPLLEKNPDVVKWGHKGALATNSLQYKLRDLQMDHVSGSFKKGEYFDAKTGQELRRPEDVSGAVVNSKGEVVLTQEEYESGKTEVEGRFGGIKRWARDLLIGGLPNKPDDGILSSGFDKSMEPAHFTELTRKSITDIIPGYLSRIHHELMILRTGDPTIDRLVYNHDRGRFTDLTKTSKDMLNRLFSKQDKDGLKAANQEFLANIDPKAELAGGQRDAITELMMDDAYDGRFDSTYARYLNVKTYTDRGVSEKDAKAIVARFKNALGYDDKERGFIDTADNAKAVNRLFNRFKSIQSYIPESQSAIHAYSDLGNIDQLLELGLIEEGEGGSYTIKRDKVRSYLKGEQYDEGTRQGVKAPGTGPFTPGNVIGRGSDFSFIQPAPATVKESQSVKEARVEEVQRSAMDDLIDAYEQGNEVLIETLKAQTEFTVDSVELLEAIYQTLQSQGTGSSNGSAESGGEGSVAGFFKRTRGRVGSVLQGFYNVNKNYLKRVGGYGAGLFKGAKKIATGGTSLLKEKWNKFRSDLKVKGTDRVVLYWNKMKNGEYFDAETGKLITHWKDIKGAVKDRFGNIVLTLEEYKEGLVNNKGGIISKSLKGIKQLVDIGTSPLKFGKKLLKSTVNTITDFVNREKDIYTPDDLVTPKLLARVLKAGGYISKTTGKRIYSWKEIDGPILDLDKNVKLSLEDFEKGLVDVDGKPLKTLMGKVSGLLKKPLNWARKGFKIGKDALTGVLSGGKDLLMGLLDKMGGAGLKVEKVDEMITINRDQLDVLKDIRDILQNQFKPKGLHDKDGDGDRDGSWEDIFNRRKSKEKDESPEVKKEKEEKEDSWWGKLSGLLMGVAGFIGTKISSLLDFFKLRAGAKVLGDTIGGLDLPDRNKPTKPRKSPGKIRGALDLVKRGGSKVGGWLARLPGAATIAKAGGWLARGAMMAKGALTLGGGSLAAGATSLAGGALASIGAALSAPVVVGAAAAATVAVGGWWLWKKYQSSKIGHLTRLRLAQYGIEYTNEKQAKRVLWLEEQLEKKIQFNGEEATINIRDVDIPTLLKNFGLDPNNKEAVTQFSVWFESRFKPVLATHVTALEGLKAPTLNLIDIDDRLPPHIKLEYLKAVKMDGLGETTDGKFSPFGDEDVLEVDKDFIDEMYTDALLKISKDRQRVENRANRLARREGITKEEAVRRINDKRGYAESGADLNVSDSPKSKTPKVDSGIETKSVVEESGTTNTGTKAVDSKDGTFKDAVKVNGRGQGTGPKPILPPELQNIGATPPPPKKIPSNEGEKEILAALVEEGITDPEEQAMVMAQMSHESAAFTRLEENLRYSASNLKRVFGRYFKRHGEAEQFAGKPEAIANRVYGGRRDLGNTEPGDGWKYRGRGFIQLTGRANYEAASRALGVDFVNNPDLVADPAYAAKVSLWWWKHRRGLRQAAQEGDVVRSTKLINGGTNGLPDRRSKYRRYLPEALSGNLIQQAIDAMDENVSSGQIASSVPVPITADNPIEDVGEGTRGTSAVDSGLRKTVTQPDITDSSGLTKSDRELLDVREKAERSARETVVQTQHVQEMSERFTGAMLRALERQLQVQVSMDSTLKSIDGKLGSIEENTRGKETVKTETVENPVIKGSRPVEIGGVKPPIDLSRSH
jgi:predicted chitinase